jgi:hypothetical protein
MGTVIDQTKRRLSGVLGRAHHQDALVTQVPWHCTKVHERVGANRVVRRR